MSVCVVASGFARCLLTVPMAPLVD